jgi:hypothetical protein
MERFSGGANEFPPILATLVTLVIGVVLIVPTPWSWWLVGVGDRGEPRLDATPEPTP